MGFEIDVVNLIEKIGFPLWAFVVGVFGYLLWNELRGIHRLFDTYNAELHDFILRTEQRITRLETDERWIRTAVTRIADRLDSNTTP